MTRIAAAALAALLLCSGCMLTKEDLDCWYDDMCMNVGGSPEKPEASQIGHDPLPKR
jgi:hypothetical protein